MGFLREMFNGPEGIISHKRVLGSVGFILVCGTMVANSFSNTEIAPSPELVAAAEYLTMSALFGTVIEKFASKKQGE